MRPTFLSQTFCPHRAMVVCWATKRVKQLRQASWPSWSLQSGIRAWTRQEGLEPPGGNLHSCPLSALHPAGLQGSQPKPGSSQHQHLGKSPLPPRPSVPGLPGLQK